VCSFPVLCFEKEVAIPTFSFLTATDWALTFAHADKDPSLGMVGEHLGPGGHRGQLPSGSFGEGSVFLLSQLSLIPTLVILLRIKPWERGGWKGKTEKRKKQRSEPSLNRVCNNAVTERGEEGLCVGWPKWSWEVGRGTGQGI
jgi:hypothetical protein